MKRLLTLLALVLCSCAETFVGEEATRPNNENLPDLTAAFAEEDNTRTYIEEGKYLRWNEDDRLTAFYGNTLNRQYKFNGATGDNSGTFSLVPDGMLGTGNTLDAIYAIYPYDENASITDNGVITLTLPAEQNYAENSFGRGANTMIAVTENLEDTFLAFKNACGYLKLRLYNTEGATIKSIEVKGNNGERLAGAATATIAFGEAPVLAMADDATTSVTLDCGEGVALGTTAETATEFWVVLPATTFAEGLTITATDTEGSIFEKSTTNEVVIERNAIQPMAVLEAKFVPIKPANNEIWYTNRSTTDATTPANTDVFGANIVSNTYDAAKECWVIKFDSELTTIGAEAFAWCESLTSVTIPESVTTIGEWAFVHCHNLTSVTIGDSVTTIGEWAFVHCHNLTSVTIGDSVTTIGHDAFAACEILTSVYISDISAWCNISFRNPSSNPLYSGCNLYLNNELVTDLTIPDSVTTIGDYAFQYCNSLTSITIPDSVTKIGNRAFWYCGSLTSVTIPNSVTSIGDYAFQHCSSLTSVTIPDSVTTIVDGAFYGCTSLTSVTIPDSVTSIGDGAFSRCKSLTSVTIPDSVTEIGVCAFYWCNSLTSITIPNSVTTIGYEAFWNCSSLTSVYCKPTTPPVALISYDNWEAFDYNASGRKIYVPMESVNKYKSASGWSEYMSDIVGYDFENGVAVTPKPANNEIWYTNGSTTEATTPRNTNVFGANIVSNTYDAAKECWVIKFDGEVTTIGEEAFENCSSLESVTIPDSVTTIGGYAFCGCSSLTSVTIPDSVTSIRYHTFYNCYSLTSVTIPDSVTEIGDSAFNYCESLTSITIPDSVTAIGYWAFQNCRSLTSVTIPDSVTTIGGYAFWGCSSLTSVYCEATTPPTASPLDYDWSAFNNNASGPKIYVPMESVEAYKSAYRWSDYADAIVGYNF